MPTFCSTQSSNSHMMGQVLGVKEAGADEEYRCWGERS